MKFLFLQTKIPLMLVTMLALSSCGSGSDSPTIQPYTTADKYIKSENFIGTILVKTKEFYLINNGFGFSDKEQHYKNNIETKYRIGSLTKAFTALGIVQLKEINLIHSYDDYLSDYINDYPNGDKITIRHLLTHRTGIPDYLSKVDSSKLYTPTQLIDLFKSDNLLFNPDEKFSYSNSNYALLGYLIEKLSGISYQRYMKDNIWSLLNMHKTEYGKSTITGENYAIGYKNLSQENSADYLNMSIPYSAGALVSNISDMEIWAESFKHNTLVSEKDNQEIFKEGEYGFGWVVIQVAGKKAYVHTGGIDGFSSIISIFPENNSLIIMLSNVENEGEKLLRILTTITKQEIN